MCIEYRTNTIKAVDLFKDAMSIFRRKYPQMTTKQQQRVKRQLYICNVDCSALNTM